jgi:hypothetical protein
VELGEGCERAFGEGLSLVSVETIFEAALPRGKDNTFANGYNYTSRPRRRQEIYKAEFVENRKEKRAVVVNSERGGYNTWWIGSEG